MDRGHATLANEIADDKARFYQGVIERAAERFQRQRLQTSPTTQDKALREQAPDDDHAVIDLPHFQPLEERSGESFAAMQEWEGYVTSVGKETFFADLISITDGARFLTETAEIPMRDLDEEQREQIAPGVIFRWLIGYMRTAKGQRRKASEIYFRRPLTFRAELSNRGANPRFDDGNGKQQGSSSDRI